MATRCKECGTLYFPPRADCPKCRGSEGAWVPIEGKGKLVTFTEVYFPPPVFQDSTPYLLGLAELEDGRRGFAPINNSVEHQDLKPRLDLVLISQYSGEELCFQP